MAKGHADDRATQQDSATHFAARKALREATLLEKLRGALIFAVYTSVYTYRCSTRLDWMYASSTYRFVEAGFDDLDGVEAAEDFYCDKDGDGGTFFWFDTVTNERCRLDYADVGEIDELQNYLATSLIPLPDQIYGTCSECAIGMTGSRQSMRNLGPDHYICSDFDPGAKGDGAGPKHDGCIGEDTTTLPHDVEWAANPTSSSYPCCRNQVPMTAVWLLLVASGCF